MRKYYYEVKVGEKFLVETGAEKEMIEAVRSGVKFTGDLSMEICKSDKGTIMMYAYDTVIVE